MAKRITSKTGNAKIQRQGHTQTSDGSHGTSSSASTKYGGSAVEQNR